MLNSAVLPRVLIDIAAAGVFTTPLRPDVIDHIAHMPDTMQAEYRRGFL